MLRHLPTTLAALLLVACQMTAPSPDADPTSPVAGDEIVVTSLDDPAGEAATPTQAQIGTVAAAPAPEAGPEAVAEDGAAADVPAADLPAADVPAEEATAEEVVTPAVLKSPEQVKCEKQGGIWARAGKSEARTCVKQTRDGGKQCTRGSQCEGLCLARSGTCAPVTPLFGCNEILEDDGRRVTLCIE